MGAFGPPLWGPFGIPGAPPGPQRKPPYRGDLLLLVPLLAPYGAFCGICKVTRTTCQLRPEPLPGEALGQAKRGQITTARWPELGA